jgi:CHAT domain-containing protein/tetratricopeptide (TPR) repeat protein
MNRTTPLLFLFLATTLAPAAAPPNLPPVWRMLSDSDHRKVTEWQKQSATFVNEGDVARAVKLSRQVYELRKAKQGDDHWQTIDARLELDTLLTLSKQKTAEREAFMKTLQETGTINQLARFGKYDEAINLARRHLLAYEKALGKGHPFVAVASMRLADLFESQGRYFDAAPYLETALRLSLKHFGPDHPTTAGTQSRLAQNLQHRGEFPRARPLHERALTAARRIFGSDSAEEATALNNLAYNLMNQGRHDEAHRLYLRSLKIRRDVLGEDSAETAQSYNNLAMNYHAQGRYALARPLFERSLSVRRGVFGDNHESTALAMGNLALCLNSQGLHADAERLYRTELEVESRRLGVDHPQTALTANNLAATLRLLGKDAEARKLYERALKAWEKSLGDNHPRTAIGYNALAVCLEAEGKYPEALWLFHRALAARRRALGENNPETLISYVNLAMALSQTGEHRRARYLLEHVVAKRRKLLGDNHPDVGEALDQLAVCLARAGDFALAEQTAEQAQRVLEHARLSASSSGLERGSLAERFASRSLLPVLRAGNGRTVAAWNALERSLARGLLDELQSAGRLLTTTERHNLEQLRARLSQLEGQLTVLAGSPGDEARALAATLRKEADKARAALGQSEADLTKRYGPAAGAVLGLADVRAALPDDAALVAWVDRPAQPARSAIGAEAWACVLRKKGAPVWVRLPGSGKGGEWTADDDRLGPRLRRALTENEDWREPAEQLYKLRLAPLTKHLRATDGLPVVRRLISLPSVRLNSVPLEVVQAARPEGAPSYVISYAPSATVFAQMRQKKKRSGTPSLLALGDPAFATVGKGDEVRTRNGLAPLPGTRVEVEAITKLFSSSESLLGSDASEAKLTELAREDQLKAFHYVHLATHGFADGERPMQSALALSDKGLGDPVRELLRGRPAWTGRLTAGQILSGWRLDAELVTLSACETGLGRYQTGEGFVGFAQALFVAGARSLVLSQWGVSDDATALLMVRFYQNLLGKREGLKKPMAKAEALEEARQWLRRLPQKEATALIESLPRGKLVVKPKARKEARPFAHPSYWAGFVLVGDPG